MVLLGGRRPASLNWGWSLTRVVARRTKEIFDCTAKQKAHYGNIGTTLLQIGLEIVDETLPESLIAEFNS